jgi:hypothetical protein
VVLRVADLARVYVAEVSGRSGYAKSDHPLLGRHRVQRAPRTPAHLLPDWRLSFTLPDTVGLGLNTGPYAGVIGVQVGPKGSITIVGKNKGWVTGQAERFVRHIAPYGFARPVRGVLERGDEPGPAHSGPVRKGETMPCTIDWDGRDVTLTTRHSSHRL